MQRQTSTKTQHSIQLIPRGLIESSTRTNCLAPAKQGPECSHSTLTALTSQHSLKFPPRPPKQRLTIGRIPARLRPASRHLEENDNCRASARGFQREKPELASQVRLSSRAHQAWIEFLDIRLAGTFAMAFPQPRCSSGTPAATAAEGVEARPGEATRSWLRVGAYTRKWRATGLRCCFECALPAECHRPRISSATISSVPPPHSHPFLCYRARWGTEFYNFHLPWPLRNGLGRFGDAFLFEFMSG